MEINIKRLRLTRLRGQICHMGEKSISLIRHLGHLGRDALGEAPGKQMGWS